MDPAAAVSPTDQANMFESVRHTPLRRIVTDHDDAVDAIRRHVLHSDPDTEPVDTTVFNSGI